MTAKQLSAPNPGDVVSTQTSRCTHESIIPGLDQIQCKTCHREWPCWHPDYERLLNQKPTPEQTTLDSALKCSGVPRQRPTPELTPERKTILWVETYPVKRGKYHYYRFCYLIDSTDIRSGVRHHIPGGDTKSLVALIRKQEIERAIAAGWWPSEIEDLIKSWKHKS